MKHARPLILFLASGLATFGVYFLTSKAIDSLLTETVPGLPFAVACSLLWVRPSRRIPLTVVLNCLSWLGALRLALFLSSVNEYLGMAVAGLLGAASLAAFTGFGHRSFWSARILGGSGVVGAIAALPFALVFANSAYETPILLVSFPIWQMAVGLWLWTAASASAEVISARTPQSSHSET
jgi:hypothetical protein